MKERLYYLDWIRIIVVVLLVPYHIALTYTGQGDAYVYHDGIKDFYLKIKDFPDFDSWILKYFVDFLSCFFMQLLFVIAGMSSFIALKRRSISQYVKERVIKLLLPAILGSILFVSITSWIRNINLFQYGGNFVEFFPLFFNGIRGSSPEANFEWGHLWFLAYLFVISMITLPLIKIKSRYNFKLSLKTFFFLLLLFEIIFRPGWPGFQNLIDDWANVTNYLLLFLFGYLIAQDESFCCKFKIIYKSNLLIGVSLFIIRTLFHQYFDFNWEYNYFTFISIILRSCITFFLVTGFLGLAKNYLNRESSLLIKLRTFAFPLYILHYAPLTIITFFIIKSTLPIWMQFSISVFLSYPFIYLLYMVVKRIPLLKKSIGL